MTDRVRVLRVIARLNIGGPALHAVLLTERLDPARYDSIDLVVQAYEAGDTADFLDATLGVDVATYLPDDLLVKVDIASMAHSLEARSPMVDHCFMEFAASIPSGLKLKGRTKKYLFKQAVRGLLPAAVIDRSKMGFGVPIDRWFRRELREMAYDTLLGRRSLERGLFRQEVVRKLLDDHVGGRAEWHSHLWCLLILELWFQRFIDEGGLSDLGGLPLEAGGRRPSE